MRWPVVGLLWACACGGPEPAPDQIALAALTAWEEIGPPPASACQIELLDVRRVSPELYPLACPAKSWACLRWGWEAPLGHLPAFPIAVINPEAAEEGEARLAVHEALHAIGRCSFRWADTYDYPHRDPAVWRPLGIETRVGVP